MRFIYLLCYSIILSSCAENSFINIDQIAVNYLKIEQLSSAPESSCFLTKGDVYCWGSNLFGTLGNGQNSISPVPQKVVGIPSGKATKLSSRAPHYHQCAIAEDEVYCWGLNRDGSLGTGISAVLEFSSAQKVIGIEGLSPTLVATGKYNTCIVFGDTVKCAGWNYANALGRGAVVGDPAIFSDVVGLPGIEVLDIRKGEHSSCVRLANNSLWCWGDGVLGGLGTGTSIHQHTAQEIFPDKVSDFTYSDAFGCVIREGRVYCWGGSSTHQIPGNAAANPTPIEITGLPEEAIDIEVSAGTICAVLKNLDTYCWGGENPYLLGRSIVGDNNIPQKNDNVPDIDNILQWNNGFCSQKSQDFICWGSNIFGSLDQTINFPKLVNGVPLASGFGMNNLHGEHTGRSSICLNTAAGDVYCWGFGYLDGTATRSTLELPSKINSLSNVSKIIPVGTGSHYCALLNNGNVTCYGTGSNGRLGNNLTSIQALPQSTYSGENATDLSCSGGSCCMVHGGEVSCWGINTNGILGDGSTTQRLVPTLNSSGRTDFSKVHMYGSTTCAQTSAGEVYCWGSTALGLDPLVNCSAAYCSNPQLVTLVNPATKLQVGNGYACALTTLKELWCWGSNSSGQLGQNHLTDSLTPVKVNALFDIDDFWITVNTTYLKANNKIFCLGSNQSLNCGVMSPESFSSPYETPLRSDILGFAQSHAASCSLTNDGRLMCWGDGGVYHGALLNRLNGLFVPKKLQFAL